MQQISIITLGIDDLDRSLRFYEDGFGWTAAFKNEEIAFYQMNGMVLGTWLKSRLAEDMKQDVKTPGAFSMAHNVRGREEVPPLVQRLVAAGGKLLTPPAETFYGGLAAYVADPDSHAWEIAWNPAWAISPEGYVTFGI